MNSGHRQPPRLVDPGFARPSQDNNQRGDRPLSLELDLERIARTAGDLAQVMTAMEWERLRDCADIERLIHFANHFPGYHGDLAYRKAIELQNEALQASNWLWAEEQGTVDAYRRFIAAWPEGRWPLLYRR